MKLLALLLAAAAALLADAAPQRAHAQPAHAAALAQDAPPTCDSCQWVVKTLKCEIEDPDTQAQLLKLVTSQLCPSLPADLSEQCLQLAPALIPGALWYLDTLSAKDLCSDVALCGAAPLGLSQAQGQAQGLRVAADNSTCAMCEYIKRAVGSVNEICGTLPDPLQPTCRLVAAAVGDLDCQTAGLCPPAWARGLAAASRGGAPLGLSPALVGALARGLLQRNTRLVLGAQLGDGPAALGQYELCDICKSVVAEAAVILANPETQKEVLSYMKTACSSLGDLENQCLSYVELYGPLVFNVIVQYLNTEACAKIGYCPASGPSSLHALHASVHGLVAK